MVGNCIVEYVSTMSTSPKIYLMMVKRWGRPKWVETRQNAMIVYVCVCGQVRVLRRVCLIINSTSSTTDQQQIVGPGKNPPNNSDKLLLVSLVKYIHTYIYIV